MGFCVMMSSILPAAAPSSPRLLEQVREQIRVRHYNLRLERAYVGWIKCYILFHGKRYRGHGQAGGGAQRERGDPKAVSVSPAVPLQVSAGYRIALAGRPVACEEALTLAVGANPG